MAGTTRADGTSGDPEGQLRDPRLAAVSAALREARQAADRVADQQGLSEEERRTVAEGVEAGPEEGSEVAPG